MNALKFSVKPKTKSTTFKKDLLPDKATSATSMHYALDKHMN